MAGETAPAAKQWYYELEGRVLGPVPERDLKLLAENGTLLPDARVWTDGMPGWQPGPAVVPRAFMNVEEAESNWGWQKVMALILAAVALGSLGLFGAVAHQENKKKTQAPEVAQADAPVPTPSATPVKPVVAAPPKPAEKPVEKPPEPTPAPPTPTPSPEPPKVTRPAVPPTPTPTPPAPEPQKFGYVNLVNSTAILATVRAWVEVDGVKKQDWEAGTKEALVELPVGRAKVRVVSVANGLTYEIDAGTVEIAAGKTKQVRLGAAKLVGKK